MTPDIPHTLQHLQTRIANAAQRAGRDPAEIVLVGASKAQPIDRLRLAYDAGLRDFGENYVQEWLDKRNTLPDDIRWHFIGHLQSNKARFLADSSNLTAVHAIDSFKAARKLDQRRADHPDFPPVDILLEVNVGHEDSKAGVLPDHALPLAQRLAELPRLRLRGLMTLPPYALDADVVRPYFSRLRTLRDRIRDTLQLDTFNQLSMGMSHDFEIAIEEGATHLRIGSALFGSRT